MVDNRPEDQNIEPESPPDQGRARRAPPTIDLKATEVSGETRNAGGDPAPEPDPQDSSDQGSPDKGSSAAGSAERSPASAPNRRSWRPISATRNRRPASPAQRSISRRSTGASARSSA